MSHTLQEGMTFDFAYVVPPEKTVPGLFPEFPEGALMPKVLATGFMVGLIEFACIKFVGLIEFACIKFINPHIDWPRQQTVGVHVNISHTAPTPPGFTVTVKGRLVQVDSRKLSFAVELGDGVDTIAKGTHDRFIIDAEKFNSSVAKKRAAGS